MSPDAFLGRALLDPTTGLPNVPYFRLIREWEERRAQRRGYSVREVTMRVSGGATRVRRALSWRLCRELRESDLVASGGPGEFHVLLTSPDAEYAGEVCARIRRLAEELNLRHPDEPPLEIQLTVEPPIEPDASAEGAVSAATPEVEPNDWAERVTTDREVQMRPSVEPEAEPSLDRRRRAPRLREPIVPPRSCPPEGGTSAA